MEAAAGKAEDCFSLREGRGGYQFCNEQPYLKGANVDLPAVLQNILTRSEGSNPKFVITSSQPLQDVSVVKLCIC
jgi:hypothetical protein